ncbi:hypothetical protein F9B85_04335 [Heliorestis acidaminivorans]|uniref:Uncharacterized protein n=1 Tax=Heliorestis acidaminivorans TaxID=553427 RepID=A0A6I0EW63_9FIRM|nr:hypothetical protein [Heliorestis acidaminivorans]KAB2953849.1 hypothetical protein F9B85_04335 [Heliorestis acidaminivorans]
MGQANHDTKTEKKSPHPWGWIPFLIILTLFATFAFGPVVAYQGQPYLMDMKVVEPQTTAQKEVLAAVEKALDTRFTALVEEEPALLATAFGSYGTANALQEEILHFPIVLEMLQAEGLEENPEIYLMPYAIDVKGHQAHVIFEYLTLFESRQMQGAHVWDLVKTEAGWKVVGDSSFIDSSTSSRVSQVARSFLTSLKFGHNHALQGPWKGNPDLLAQMTEETVSVLAGQGGSWEVLSVTLFGNHGSSHIPYADMADASRVIVQNAETEERYVMVLARIDEATGIMGAPKWTVIGFVAEQELLDL